jgi:ATP-dependent RNA helicase DDX24/MAK5
LAIQVTDHLKKAGEFIDCHIVPIVGGMSTEKQDRLIKKVPDVVVATPGRLYQFLSQDSEFAKNLLHIRYFVLDEADRMLENGHFKNLDDIIETISVQKIQEKVKRQTFVFSATMLEDNSMKQKASNSKKSEKSILFDNLLKKIEFRDDQPVYVNLTREQVTAKGVLESKINCLKTDKDLMLYYVLTRYTGKTIVFVNSIDAIRRLVPILSHLKSGVFGLHAELQQKQRLKNLERFKQIPDAVLIASDVAARGLDIPNVDHVVHYQLPRTADIYVHRAGRTARGIDKEGISVMLLSPEEMTTYKKICFTLSKPDGLPDFPVDSTISSKIKQRLTLARQIDQLEHKQKKNKTETDWFKKAAEEADILVSSGESDQEERLESDKKQKNQIMKLKQQLQTLMQKQVIPKGQSASYITMKTNAAQNAINSKGMILFT